MVLEHYDVILVTDDHRLREAVEAGRPEWARLLTITHAAYANGLRARPNELWLDLDGEVQAAVPTAARNVYFYKGSPPHPAERPAGMHLRKPCAPEAVAILWAGVAEEVSHQSSAVSAALLSGDLPAWILDFQEIDWRELSRRVVQQLPERLGFSRAALYLYDDNRQLLTLAESSYAHSIDLAVRTAPDCRNLLAEAARTRAVIAGDDLTEEAKRRNVTCPPDMAAPPDRSGIVAPLCSGDRLAGLLRLGERRPVSTLPGSTKTTQIAQTDPPTAVAAGLWAFLGRAIEHARRFELAQTEARIDGLTGLYNYRWLSEALDREIRRVERFQSRISLIQLDLDDFKEVNDRFGHVAGDSVLRHAAGRIRSVLRQVDAAVRLGGDEFAVLLPETDLDGARHVAERILQSLHDHPPVVGDRIHLLTCSVGVAQWRAGGTHLDLLESADQAMYAAKRQGGNRVIAPPTQPATTAPGA